LLDPTLSMNETISILETRTVYQRKETLHDSPELRKTLSSLNAKTNPIRAVFPWIGAAL
jgi:hypothetical protein